MNVTAPRSARTLGTGETIDAYEIADDALAAGSTLGGPRICLTIKASGAIEKIYSSDAGEVVFGAFVLRFWDRRSGVSLLPLPGHFSIHPEHQEHFYALPGGLTIHETAFALSGAPDGTDVDAPAAYLRVRITNGGTERAELATYGFSQLRGHTEHDVAVRYDARRHAIVAWNEGHPDVVRMFGVSEVPQSFETTNDHAKVLSPSSPGMLADSAETKPGQDTIGAFSLAHDLEPGDVVDVTFTFSFSHLGAADAAKNFDAAPAAAVALEKTKAYYADVLGRAAVLTPEAEINRGVLWAKANMLRTILRPATGWSFVNDPTRSNNSVGRDTAWFGYGADYVLPDVSRDALLAYARLQEPSGMIVEYYDVRTGKAADYSLNINDNTPLLILAWFHHYLVSGDDAFLNTVYPNALKAARYILSQRDERGLVWCTSTKTSDWGIVGWRNVIQNYRLSGATTELNSECYAAFATIAKMADRLGHDNEAREFDRHAGELRAAINEHLYNDANGLYFLNIDVDGQTRTDITADLVFPVMFGVADDETAARIIRRLSADDFWTNAGIRVVPRGALEYGATHGYGLLGGVWVGQTFWYAFAAARYDASFMARALSSSFKHYSEDPRRNNTVPGQFSEWLHGETLVNQGMMLSPWFPPRYIWASVEGCAGFDAASDPPALHPRLAPEWKWLGVRRLQFRGRSLTWFVARTPDLCVYANETFQTEIEAAAYEDDITPALQTKGHACVALGLRRGDVFALFVGNTVERTIQTSLSVDLELGGSYTLRRFDSLHNRWRENIAIEATMLSLGIPIEIERGGFSLFELTPRT
jgi:glycogen debranching enzyme